MRLKSSLFVYDEARYLCRSSCLGRNLEEPLSFHKMDFGPSRTKCLPHDYWIVHFTCTIYYVYLSDQRIGRRSVSFLKRGAVIGIVSGILATSISLSIIFFRVREDIFLHPWFDRVLVYAMILGVSAGIISGFGNDLRRHVYSYSFVGLIAGGLASSAHHFAVVLATAMAFLLFQTGSSVRLSWLFSNLVFIQLRELHSR